MQHAAVAGALPTTASPVQPELPQLPVSLSPYVLTVMPRSAPSTQSTPLLTLTVQQNCQLVAPLQKSPKLFPGSPSLSRSKKKPGPTVPMAVAAVPVQVGYQPQVPVLGPQVGGGGPGVSVPASHPGPSTGTRPWNQLALVVFQKVTVKQKVTDWPPV